MPSPKDFNPADLVPFITDPNATVGPDKISRKQAAKELGIPYFEEDEVQTVAAFATLRNLVSKIPTPTRDEGGVLGSFSATAVAKDGMTAVLDLMEMPTTGHIVPERVMQAALDFTPGASSVAAKTLPMGSIGMFGSRPGRYAAPDVHARFMRRETQANEMEAAGESLEAIWQKTGFSKDHRGKWRYSITEDIDNPAMARVKWDKYDAIPSPTDKKAQPVILGELLDSPNTYEHWPELKEIPVFDGSGQGHTSYAWYDRDIRAIYINKDRLLAPDPDDEYTELEAIVHEAQHALQDLQGRPGGSSPDWAEGNMKRAIKGVREGAAAAKRQFGRLTNNQEAMVRRADQIEKIWNYTTNLLRVSKGKAAYHGSPGEVEAKISQMMAKNPELAKLYPDSFEMRTTPGVNAPEADKLFEPEDLQFPSNTLDLQAEPTVKTFGKRGVQESHPMESPDFDKLPPEVKNIITDEVPSVLNRSGSRFAGDAPDNRNIEPRYWPTVVESLTRKAQNFRREAMRVLESGGPDEWAEAIELRRISKEAEEHAAMYSNLIEKGSRSDMAGADGPTNVPKPEDFKNLDEAGRQTASVWLSDIDRMERGIAEEMARMKEMHEAFSMYPNDPIVKKNVDEMIQESEEGILRLQERIATRQNQLDELVNPKPDDGIPLLPE